MCVCVCVCVCVYVCVCVQNRQKLHIIARYLLKEIRSLSNLQLHDKTVVTMLGLNIMFDSCIFL